MLPLLLTGTGDTRHFMTVELEAEGWPEEWLTKARSLGHWTGRGGAKRSSCPVTDDASLICSTHVSNTSRTAGCTKLHLPVARAFTPMACFSCRRPLRSSNDIDGHLSPCRPIIEFIASDDCEFASSAEAATLSEVWGLFS